MMFVYHYVIIPFHPQYLPKHVSLILQGGRCQIGGCRCPRTYNFSLLTLFQPMLNHIRKFEDVKSNIFQDMTLQSRCISFRTPGLPCLNQQLEKLKELDKLSKGANSVMLTGQLNINLLNY